jgi:hypothetical protein
MNERAAARLCGAVSPPRKAMKERNVSDPGQLQVEPICIFWDCRIGKRLLETLRVFAPAQCAAHNRVSP